MLRSAVVAGLFSVVLSVRLGISNDLVKNEPVEEGTGTAEGDDLIDAIIALGMEKCTALVTSSSTYSHFKTSLQLFFYQEHGAWPDYDSFINWQWGAQPYWILQQSSPNTRTFPFPVWDSGKVKFRIMIRQFEDDTSKMWAEYRKIPARRIYLVVVGKVEHSDESSREDEAWEPQWACDGSTLITYRFIIDLFKTGDDFTKWPHAEFSMGDHPHIGNEDSVVNVRKGEHNFDGSLLTELAKDKDRKGFWILDATYVDYVDFVIGDSGAALKKDGYIDHTFWKVFGSAFKDLHEQRDHWKDPGEVYWLTHPFAGRRLNTAFPDGRTTTVEGEFGTPVTVWRPTFSDEDGKELHESHIRVDSKGQLDGGVVVTVSSFAWPGYNSGNFDGPGDLNLNVTLYLPDLRNSNTSARFNDLMDMNTDEILKRHDGLIGEHTLFTEFHYDDDKAVGNILPIVVCGLFSKVFPFKSCPVPKPEEEA